MQNWLVALQVIFTLLHCLAVASACFRLHRRKIIGQIYWDDYTAAIALVLNLTYFPTLWFPNNFHNIMVIDPKTNRTEVMIEIVYSWFFHIVWSFLVWTTRISLGLSITRVLPKKSRFYYASRGIVVAFVASAIAVVVISAIYCARSYPTWSITPPFRCYPGPAPYIAFASMDVIADLLLVVVPLWAFWRQTRLTPMNRRIIKIGFAVNGVTALASLITGVILIVNPTQDYGMAIRITTHIMSVISILACNSLVVVTSLYRHFRTKVPEHPRDPRQQHQQQHHQQQHRQQHIMVIGTSLNRPTTTHTGATGTTNTTTHYTTSHGPSTCTDQSRQPLPSPDSLRLTLTIVHTDPSLIF